MHLKKPTKLFILWTQGEEKCHKPKATDTLP